MVEGTEKKTDDKSVVEKRLKPTLIRRRASKSEAPPPAEIPVATAAPEEKPVVTAPTEEKKTPPPPVTAPVQPVAPRIGLVGHINDLMPATTTTTVREDWREKQQIKAPKKKRTAYELEMEMIQRAGGLKQFAGAVQLDDVEEVQPVATPSVPIVEERIFQPTSTGRKRKATRREFKKTSITETKTEKKVIRIEEGITVTNLSQATGRGIAEIIKRLMELGMMATANQILDLDVASMLAEESGYKVERTGFREEDVLQSQQATTAENLTSRPPVVTVMGHVDHGKT
ncbi:MAG: translation initiation factor IF-2 N-terminal domain-containing protein, partial [Deltaproteobacteria bacterium]|nr:translation initiation factor IF-2 N-terminal domain-containing protein [Deltaproteobacteria bacterium]